jgi:hypothetical protein
MKINPANGNIYESFSLEGFNPYYWNTDTPTNLWTNYLTEDDEDDAYIFFVGSYSYWAKSDYRFVIFKSYTSTEYDDSEDDYQCTSREDVYSKEINESYDSDEIKYTASTISLTEFSQSVKNTNNGDFDVLDLSLTHRDVDQMCDNYEGERIEYSMFIGDASTQKDSI